MLALGGAVAVLFCVLALIWADVTLLVLIALLPPMRSSTAR